MLQKMTWNIYFSKFSGGGIPPLYVLSEYIVSFILYCTIIDQLPGHWKQWKWNTEMVKMKIVYCLIYTSLKRPLVKQDH